MKSFIADSYELAPLKTILAHGTVTVDSTAGGTKIPATASAGRRVLIIHNADGALDMHWGKSGVTTANGMPLDFGEKLILDLGPDQDLYGIVGAGESIDVRYTELGG